MLIRPTVFNYSCLYLQFHNYWEHFVKPLAKAFRKTSIVISVVRLRNLIGHSTVTQRV